MAALQDIVERLRTADSMTSHFDAYEAEGLLGVMEFIIKVLSGLSMCRFFMCICIFERKCL